MEVYILFYRLMQLFPARLKERDRCFSYVSEAALHIDNCDAHMRGVASYDGTSNRGLGAIQLVCLHHACIFECGLGSGEG